MFAHICRRAGSTVELWADPAVGTLDPEPEFTPAAHPRPVGSAGLLVAPVGPVHDLQFACALVRSTGGVSRKRGSDDPQPVRSRRRSGCGRAPGLADIQHDLNEPGNADSDDDPQSATEKGKMKDALDDLLRPS
jgi:hypothetical protein